MPKEVLDFSRCVQGTTTGNEGDVVVWGDILVRSWNSPAPAGGAFCGDLFTPAGKEGLHIFDVSNPRNPRGLAFVPVEGGSHTATGVPDLANDRLLIYNSASSAARPGIDIVEIPLSDPATACVIGFEPANRACHDTAVILGDANLAACAGHDGFTVCQDALRGRGDGRRARALCPPAPADGRPNNFKFYDISGEIATNPRLIGQLNQSTHEFFLWRPFAR